MKWYIKLISCAFIVMMALALVPSGIVSGETTNQFGDGSTKKTVTFDDAGSDNSTTIKLPYEAEVKEATLKLTGDDNGGEYLYHPTFLIENRQNSPLWNFNGSGSASGYGHLGEQQVFRDNSSSSSLSFSGEEEKTSYLYLPKNATVKDATMQISGRKSAGTMTPPEVLSEGTLITSSAAFPAVASEGSNIYMAWLDNGDLDYAGKDQDIFFKRSTDNGQSWSKAICLSESTMSSYSPPSIAVNGNEVCVAWTEGGLIPPSMHFRMSKDGGDTWKKIVRIEGNADNNPVVGSSGSYKYLVWDYSQKVYFTRST
ncbi:exo-alpha-sialidase, partial [bacterium]|nr:exo-alpha-sialidase [bacterium]